MEHLSADGVRGEKWVSRSFDCAVKHRTELRMFDELDDLSQPIPSFFGGGSFSLSRTPIHVINGAPPRQ